MARHGGFPGMGAGNIQQLMKQAQRAQQDVTRAQEEVSAMEFEASVGGGAVKAIVTGAKEFKSITISPDCVDPEDVETLQDLVLAAVKEAIKMADDAMTEAINKATGGINLGMLGL